MNAVQSRMWTKQEDGFVAEGRRCGHSFGMIARRLNAIFERGRTADAVRNRYSKFTPVPERITKPRRPAWSKAEDALLLALWLEKGASARDASTALSERFGIERSRCAVLSRLARVHRQALRKATASRVDELGRVL